ncbi:putative selT-like protein C35C5.3 [Hypsibius exemplaris]|uniref:SelT-like protein C35C5.3 n=1 Tax=Hypsibius exemplaris TaxID=2072580 RepID=A0A1W0X0U8_HYPEX|nr:putative selT-like protein C35C5.3 [Hypsibius exemplaris]
MADNVRILAYGLLLNLFFFLTVLDLMRSPPSTAAATDEAEEQAAILEKGIPQPKLMNMEMPLPTTAGPVLKILFCSSCGYRKTFDQFRTALLERHADLLIEGGNFEPALWRTQLAKAMSYLKIAVVALLISGFNPFPALGMDTPQAYSWAVANKIYAGLMAWFLLGIPENSLISTGAFEVFYNGVPVWSKLESGRMPDFQELLSIVGQHREYFKTEL